MRSPARRDAGRRRPVLRIAAHVLCLLALTGLVLACAPRPEAPRAAGTGPSADEARTGARRAESRRDRQSLDDAYAIQAACQDALLTDRTALDVFEALDLAVYEELEPPFHGEAKLHFVYGDGGQLEQIAIRDADSDATRALLTRAIDRIQPFPRASEFVSTCQAGIEFTVPYKIVRELTCPEQEDYQRYLAEVQQKIYPLLYSYPNTTRPGRGYVSIGLRLDADGGVGELVVHRSPDPLAAEKLEKAVRAGAPYDPPPLFETCFEGVSLRLRFEVQGDG